MLRYLLDVKEDEKVLSLH